MKAYTFSDVCIVPKKSSIPSRDDIKFDTKIGNHSYFLPIASANMPAIASPVLVQEVCLNGGCGIMHRFCEIDEAEEQFKYTQDYIRTKLNMYDGVGVSIGVKEADKKRFETLYQTGARVFCIDVAHGHHELVHEMLKWINNQIFLWDRSGRGNITLIAGNIATAEAALDLGNWGADAVKVGIGPGSACTTRLDTGVGVPQLFALEQVYNAVNTQKTPVSIIADGGCSCVGDIAKALKFADMVMVGKMLAGTLESPGDYINVGGRDKKVFYGSASFRNKGQKKHIEGRDFLVDRKGPVESVLNKISDGLKSSFSYTGSSN